MKRLAFLMLTALLAHCGKKTKQEEFATAGDRGIPLSTVMQDGRVWTAKNLEIDVPDSYCYLEDSDSCRSYGRLYTWKAAINACDKLGDGWRLPTNEEWQVMVKFYGGVYNDSEDMGQSAYQRLIKESGFGALHSGNREPDGTYVRIGDHGFYWTLTEEDSSNAWFYNFAKGATLLNRHPGNKQMAASVRCIQDN